MLQFVFLHSKEGIPTNITLQCADGLLSISIISNNHNIFLKLLNKSVCLEHVESGSNYRNCFIVSKYSNDYFHICIFNVVPPLKRQNDSLTNFAIILKTIIII